jgi:hypothetical protein
MKVDLTKEEISWIQHLADRSISQWEDDIKDKEKNTNLAISNIKQSLSIYNKLDDYGQY